MNINPEGFDDLDPLSQRLWLITESEISKLRGSISALCDIIKECVNAVCDLQDAWNEKEGGE